MAKIPLRAYNREIELLVERGQIDEAIAHAKYILRIFPKHIDTYRLLGKAFIESQRYSEAADILQRILSVIPDDFVSQIGMSIIREDEGNLDAAIFHMERAYEIQPSNAAIQDELRRLYGRRDGIEPPKLRLTRGALVRMYARGDLYRQAVAEARAALSENPERYDLEAILARMYFMQGLKVEATEAATRLISRLPFCLEANRILADSLPGSTRAAEADLYRARVQALDPYLAYTSTNQPFSTLVPDNAVTLDRLEVEGGSVNETSDWAKDLGVDIPKEEPEVQGWPVEVENPEAGPTEQPLPISNTPPEQVTDFQPGAPEPLPAPQEKIPEWMASAGWNPSTSEVSEESPSEITAQDEAVPAEMPDWLKSMQPVSSAPLSPPGNTVEEDTEPVPDWLMNIKSRISEETARPPESLDPQAGQVEEFSPETIPGKMEQQKSEDWFSLETEPEPALKIDSNETEPAAEQFQELPGGAPDANLAPIPGEVDEGIAWLESLAARQGADQQTLSTPAENTSTEPPEWVIQELGEEQMPVSQVEPEVELPILEVEAEPEVELPVLEAAVEPEVELPVLEAIAEPEVELPVLEAESEPEVELPVLQAVIEPEVELPILEAIAEPEAELPVLESIAEPEAELPVLEAAVEPEVELHVLEVESEPEVELPVLEVESEPEAEFPVLKGESEPEVEFPVLKGESEPEVELPGLEVSVEPEAELPVLEVEAGPEVESPVLEAKSEPEAELPVLEAAIEPEVKLSVLEAAIEPEVELPVLEAESEPEAELPVLEAESEPEAELPVLETESEPEVEVPVLEVKSGFTEDASMDSKLAPPPEDDFEATFAWLESLAAQQGADAETLTSAPSERPSAPPAWVIDTSTPSPELSDGSGLLEGATIDRETSAEPLPELKQEFVQEFPAPPSLIPVGSEKIESLPVDSGLAEPIGEPEISGSPTNVPIDITVEPEINEGDTKPLRLRQPTVEPAPMPVHSQKEPGESIRSFEPGLEAGSREPLPETEALPAWLVEKQPQIPPEGLAKTGSLAPLPEWLQGIDEKVETPPAPISEESLSVSDWLAARKSPVEEPIQGQDEQIDMPLPAIEEGKLPEVGRMHEQGPSESPPTIPSNPLLAQAQTEVISGKIEAALNIYAQLSAQPELVDETIQQIRFAISRHPDDVSLWQALGDAYIQKNQIPDALDAYNKAEELCR